MAKRNYKYNSSVDLSGLPTRTSRNYIDWENSKGFSFPFSFNDDKLVGEFTIVDYKIPEGLTHKHVYLEYNGKLLKPILPSGIINATFSNILDEFYIEWAFDIGDILCDKTRNLQIINRKREKDVYNYYRKYYQVKCLNCGFDGFGYYYNDEYREEYWVSENDLIRTDKRRIDCSCCNSKIVVSGINDIPTTAPWMVDYFQGGYEEAKKYSKYSSTKKFFKCIHCNKISNKKRKITDLYINNNLPCICNDNISYPNKFAYYFFEQLKSQYDYYENEYSPGWAGLYRYDNYIVKGKEKYIIEMDGGLGHGNKQFKSNSRDTEGLKRDKIKEKLAIEHNISIIRIDCLISQMDYIKNSLVEKLSNIFDLSNINWEQIDIDATNKNIYKEICNYFNQNPNYVTKISRELKIGVKIVRSALQLGNRLGWCNYTAYNKFQEEKFFQLIEYWNNHKYIRTSVLSQKFNLGQTTIVSYLNKATKLGLCDYDPIKSVEYEYENKDAYPIYVFDLNLNFLKQYKSSNECEEKSDKDFGTHFNKRNIDYVCTGRSKQYKGYYFSRSMDIDKNKVLDNLNSDNHIRKVVYVYKPNLSLCGEYSSIKELGEKSLEDFGVKFQTSNISNACIGKLKTYKGYIFSHELLCS